MHSTQLPDQVHFKGNLLGKISSSTLIDSRKNKKGVEYADEIMELPSTFNLSHLQSRLHLGHKKLPQNGFR